MVAVFALECRTAHHATVVAARGQPFADRLQPWVPVVVVQRLRRRSSWRCWPAGGSHRRRRTARAVRCASAAPTVDLPDPDTPMTTIGDAIHSPYPFVHDITQHALIIIRLQALSRRDHVFNYLRQAYDKMYRVAASAKRRRAARNLLTALGTGIVSGRLPGGPGAHARRRQRRTRGVAQRRPRGHPGARVDGHGRVSSPGRHHHPAAGQVERLRSAGDPVATGVRRPRRRNWSRCRSCGAGSNLPPPRWPPAVPIRTSAGSWPPRCRTW